jgi:hypothetical protein
LSSYNLKTSISSKIKPLMLPAHWVLVPGMWAAVFKAGANELGKGEACRIS